MENRIEGGFFIGGINNWYDYYMAQEIELIAAYIEEGEIAISDAQISLEKYRTIEVDNPDTHYPIIRSYFREVDGDTFNLDEIYGEYFPMLTRHSTLVMVMSMFEKKLFGLCISVQNEFDIPQPFEKFQARHKGKLRAMKLYLSEEANLSFSPTLVEHWSDLMSLHSIRNNIVHNFGTYQVTNEYIDKFIEDNNYIHISPSNEFIFTNTFLSALIPFFNSFCKELQVSIRHQISIN